MFSLPLALAEFCRYVEERPFSIVTPEELRSTKISVLRLDCTPDDVLYSIYLKALEYGDQYGYEQLSRIESLVVACWLTWGAMGNGGVYCAMNNPYSLMEAAEAMDSIGHHEAAEGLRSGSTKLFPCGQSPDMETNREWIIQYEDFTGKDPDELFENFANSATDMTERLITYIFTHWDECIASDERRMAT